VLEAIIAAMPDRGRSGRGEHRPEVSLTKLRLRVIAYTGFSHGELAGIREADLHLDAAAPWVWVGGRRKGAGTSGVAQPLTPAGAAALGALRDAGGLGAFSTDSMRQSWRRACKALNLDKPYPRPYDARHSFATEILATTGNLTAVQLNMRHRDARTSRRYAEQAIDPARLAGLQLAVERGAFRPSSSGGVTPTQKHPRKHRSKSV
jgi:integrase